MPGRSLDAVIARDDEQRTRRTVLFQQFFDHFVGIGMPLGEVDRHAVVLDRLRQAGRSAGGVEHNRRCLALSLVDRGGEEVQQREARAMKLRSGPAWAKMPVTLSRL